MILLITREGEIHKLFSLSQILREVVNLPLRLPRPRRTSIPVPSAIFRGTQSQNRVDPLYTLLDFFVKRKNGSAILAM